MLSAIRALILSDSTTNGLISGNIFAVYAPENQPRPFLVLSEITSHDERTLNLKVVNTRRLQVDIWGDTFSSCESVEVALRNALLGYVGPLNDGSRVIDSCRENIISSFPPISRQYRLSVDYEITIQEV